MHTPSRLSTAALLAGLLLAGAAQAMPRQYNRADYGTPVMSGAADRTIVVDARTRFINVVNGETVQFDVDGKRFTFAFDAWSNLGQVDLSAIAPGGVTVPKVTVYIGANPLNQG